MNRQTLIVDDKSNSLQFCEVFRSVSDGLTLAKKGQPQYKSMKYRKFFLLCYLAGIEQQRARFSLTDIRFFFRGSDAKYYADYWEKLKGEGWINELPARTRTSKRGKAILPRSPSGVLSPLFVSLLSRTWGARLRRVVGYHDMDKRGGAIQAGARVPGLRQVEGKAQPTGPTASPKTRTIADIFED